MSATIFDKIVSREIPSSVVFEDELCLAFRDISPCAPVHVLLIPKAKDGLDSLSMAEPRHAQLLGHLMVKAPEVAALCGLQPGWRLVVNVGKQGCQTVDHLHLHIIGGKQLAWPPGTGALEGPKV
jgi:diadenosine tetraphosphate (Ap4A) HIT family hydrolase